VKKRAKKPITASDKERLLLRNPWEVKLYERICEHHTRLKLKVVRRIMKRAKTTREGLIVRSRKHKVACDITSEQLLKLIYDAYGKPCKYCGKTMKIANMAVDHIHPISKGGNSTVENLQIICQTSNRVKGSLEEQNFQILLDWLETVPPELKKDVSIRLARGII